MTHHHPVDFHADQSFYGIGAERFEVEHMEVGNPHVAAEKARICSITMFVSGSDQLVLELDERTAVSFCQAILAGFDHPDLPAHRGELSDEQAGLVLLEARAKTSNGTELFEHLHERGYTLIRNAHP